MNDSFLRAVILKVAFNPEPLRKVQAALLYVALTGETFTADILPGELINGDTRLAGCATGALATMRLIERVGRVKSPAKSRNGCWVNSWRIASGRIETVKVWLKRNGFELPSEKQAELAIV